MAFLRSSVLLKNALRNIQYTPSFWVGGQAIPSTIQIHSTIRNRYIDNVEITLDERLQKLAAQVQAGGFVSREHIDNLMTGINKQPATSAQFLQLFEFLIGKVMPEEMPKVRVVLALRVWKLMDRQNIIDISLYNGLLKVYVDNAEPFTLDGALKDVKSRNLSPNQATFEAILDNYSQMGDLEGVHKTMESIKCHEIALSRKMYHSLVLAHSFAGEQETALQLLNKMNEAGFRQTHNTYVTMLRVYAQHGDIDTILTKIKSSTTSLSNANILQLIYDLADNGYEETINKLIALLQKDADYVPLAIQTIVRLAHNERDLAALELIKAIQSGKEQPRTVNISGILLKELVAMGRPIAKIIEICNYMKAQRLHMRPLYEILTICQSGPPDSILSILRAIKNQALPLHEDQFKALFDLCASHNEALELLRTMIKNFNINPSFSFLRLTVMPKLNIRMPDVAISSLVALNIPISNAAFAVIYYCLEDNDLRNATEIMNFFKLSVDPKQCKPLLISAFKTMNDVDNYVLFLRLQCEHGKHETRNIDELLYDTLIEIAPEQRVKLLTDILRGLIDHGMKISAMLAEQIKDYLQLAITEDIESYLKILTTGDINLKKINKPQLRIKSNSLHYEKLIAQGKARNITSYKMDLLEAYYRENDFIKYEQYFEELENDQLSMSALMCARLISCKVKAGNMAVAFELLETYKSQDEQFHLLSETLIEAVAFFIGNDQFDEALRFVASNARTQNAKMDYAQNKRWNRFLDELADQGKWVEVNQLFQCLVESGLVKITEQLLSPLVKVHLINNDVYKAISTFELLSNQYREIPLKHDLFIDLIAADDLINLQRIIDISVNLQDPANILTDLAIAFIECARFEQAQKIFMSSEFFPCPQIIWKFCEQYNKNGFVEHLENLEYCTRSAKNMYREPIFLNLFDLYVRQNELGKTLDLCDFVQENNVELSETTLEKLDTYLSSKGVNNPIKMSSTA